MEQLTDVAMTNLERRAASIRPSAIQHAVMSGRSFRLLHSPTGRASSVLLVPDQLKRLFGSQDQMLAAPGRHTLASFPMSMPTLAASEIAVDLEQDELAPLFLSPFLLCDGELFWDADELTDELDEDDVG